MCTLGGVVEILMSRVGMCAHACTLWSVRRSSTQQSLLVVFTVSRIKAPHEQSKQEERKNKHAKPLPVCSFLLFGVVCVCVQCTPIEQTGGGVARNVVSCPPSRPIQPHNRTKTHDTLMHPPSTPPTTTWTTTRQRRRRRRKTASAQASIRLIHPPPPHSLPYHSAVARATQVAPRQTARRDTNHNPKANRKKTTHTHEMAA